MIKKRKYTLFISFIFICSFLPVIQMWFHPIPEKKLSGVHKRAALPEINVRSWFAGEFQSGLDAWFRQNFGLRTSLIRMNNQVSYSFFHEISTKSLVFGKDNQMFELWYILWYRKLPPYAPMAMDALETKVQEISEIQNLLKQKGITFLVFITPNKASIYPEYIPERYQENKEQQVTNYDLFVPLLDKYQVNYMDSYQTLLTEKKKSPYLLFPKGGTHWNQYGAYIATQALLKKIENLTGQDIPQVKYTKISFDQNPLKSDKDLAELLNLMRTPTNYSVPHLEFSTENIPGDKFDILFEGGSFMDGILNILKKTPVFNQITYYYYYHTQVSFPRASTDGLIEKELLNWEERVFNHKIIVLELNQFVINEKMGSGFIQDMLRELKE